MRLRLLLLLVAVVPLPGCYLVHTAAGQWDLNSRRVPIAGVVAAPTTPPALRTQLGLALRIREFATRELGLPDNQSYRTYADVGRPYVVWNVFATPEFSVDPKTWCFPVAGCVAYRGYFAERRARDFALGLEARGYDVEVGGVAAYSTLGHFADPVLNTMLRWDETELAAQIFHELAHQRLYVPGDTEFNEAFATVVETEGVARWLSGDDRSDALGAFRLRQDRYAKLAAMFSETRAELRVLYARDLPDARKRAAKVAAFDALRQRYADRRAEFGGAFEWLLRPGLNNARLLSVATYQGCVPLLRARLAETGNDLPRFYAELRAETGGRPRGRYCHEPSPPAVTPQR
jgi:predicted aminopeptidase